MTLNVSKEPDAMQIQDALKSVLDSRVFADARRLKSFLSYIVQETLDGRGQDIRAKLIASDVYNRQPEDGSEQEAIVRVDAGRLRRRQMPTMAGKVVRILFGSTSRQVHISLVLKSVRLRLTTRNLTTQQD